MTDLEIKQLAIDIEANKVFGSWNIPDNNTDMLLSIFMVLALGGAEKLPKDTIHVYEYLDRAGTRSINGYPIFSSLSAINEKDCNKLQSLLDKLKEQKIEFLAET